MTDIHVPDAVATLPGGGLMPLLGYGTWQLRGDQAVEATAAALEAGYRHLDTATIYHNEKQVGRGLDESGLKREQVFVTTKCPPDRGDRALDTLKRSLDDLSLEYVDLWLIHWSNGDAGDLALWRSFVEARDLGLARDIGVSNLSPDQVERLATESGARPAVNQIRWSPLRYDAAVAEAHRDQRVVLEGYSGLKGGILTDTTVTGIADRLGRTPAQVVVRWHLQHEFVVIPKSSRPERIRANADVGGFELTEDDMAALDALGATGS